MTIDPRTIIPLFPVKQDVLPPRKVDQSAADLLDQLGNLQTLMAMQMSRGEVWVKAWELVQETRIFIIDRIGS